MGYTTDFEGNFYLNKPLTTEDKTFLEKLHNTRRMARNVGHEYGIEGEFYVDGEGFYGQDDEENIIDHNRPPSTQPGLWCQWVPTEDGTALVWDGGEKFHHYAEWITYIIDRILAPKGYVVNGEVKYQGEDPGDVGKIVVEHNSVSTVKGQVTYGDNEQIEYRCPECGIRFYAKEGLLLMCDHCKETLCTLSI